MGGLYNLAIEKSYLEGVGCWLFAYNLFFLTKKWPVAPELEMAYFTALHTFGLPEMAADIGSSCKFFACTRVYHTDTIVCIAGGALHTMGSMGVTAVAWRLIFPGI